LRASLQDWLHFRSTNESTLQIEVAQQSLIAIKHIAEGQGWRSAAEQNARVGQFCTEPFSSRLLMKI
jgi:hypothetical protein